MNPTKWLAEVFAAALREYNNLDDRMQRLLRWLIRAFIFLIFSIPFYLFWRANRQPEIRTVYKTQYRDTALQKIVIRDTCASKTPDVYKTNIKEATDFQIGRRGS